MALIECKKKTRDDATNDSRGNTNKNVDRDYIMITFIKSVESKRHIHFMFIIGQRCWTITISRFMRDD